MFELLMMIQTTALIANTTVILIVTYLTLKGVREDATKKNHF